MRCLGGGLVILRDGMPIRRPYRECRMPLTVHASMLSGTNNTAILTYLESLPVLPQGFRDSEFDVQIREENSPTR